jgi:superfamily I DNA/RNA helicase
MTIEGLCTNLTTTKELIDKIEEIFGEKNKNIEGIALSTIHKAKGLEADNVYILCKDLMPSPSAKMDWERKQERNLIYVAYTRAKKILGFINDDDLKKINPYNEISLSLIKEKEAIVQKLYGTVFSEKATEQNASRIVELAKNIDKKDANTNIRTRKISICSNEDNKIGIVPSLMFTKRKKKK